MKFYIPTKTNFIINKLLPDEHQAYPGIFVWGYHTDGPLIYTGVLTSIKKTAKGTRYTIELVDGTSLPVDVDHVICVPSSYLPYVVDAQNNVYRISRVDYARGELLTTAGYPVAIKDVQPVQYQDNHQAKMAVSDISIPNRDREEGV